MGFRILLAFSLAILGQQLSAQSGAFLWKLTADHFEQPSYVMAVLHTTNQDFSPSESAMQPYMGQCKSFASLWPVDARSKNNFIVSMQIRDAKAMRRTLGKVGYNSVEQLVIDRLETDLVYYQYWQPIYLRKTLMDRGLKNGGNRLVEESVYKRAQNFGLTTGPIVSPQNLGLIVSQVPYEEQAGLLLDYCNDPQNYEQLLEALQQDYANADFTAIRNVLNAVESPGYISKMIDMLNSTMAVRISELSMESPTFFAIEAQHFGGNNNLLDQLTKLGITVTPVALEGFEAKAIAEGTEPLNSSITAVQIDTPKDGIPRDDTPKNDTPAIETTDGPKTSVATPAAGNSSSPFLIGQFNYFNYQVDSNLLVNWVSLQIDQADFSASMPTYPRFNSTSFTGDEGRIEMQYYALDDSLQNLYYIISRNNYPPGFSLKNENKFFDKNVKSVIKQFNGQVLAEETVSGLNYSGRRFVLGLANGEVLRSTLYFSDNRLYQVAVMGPTNKVYSEASNTFLGNFKINLNQKDWATVNGNGFTVQMPLQPVSKNAKVYSPDGDIAVEHYNVNEPSSGLLYSLYVNRYPDAFRSGNLSGYYDRLSRETLINLRAYPDKEESLGAGKKKARYVEARSAEKSYRIYFLLKDKTLYQLVVSGSPQSLKTADMNYFINNLRFH